VADVVSASGQGYQIYRGGEGFDLRGEPAPKEARLVGRVLLGSAPHVTMRGIWIYLMKR